MREAQREALYSLPNLGRVVLNDKATLNNIHPPYKKAAGERLAAWALNKVYGKNIPYSGPLFRGFKVRNGEMTVSFDYSDGLNGSASAFEIAGEDGIFHKAEGRIADDKVILKSSAVKHPISVRYAWGNTATRGLFNKAGLPASSFTTAEWKDAPAKK
jgi:sialate O-acetylesterase